MADAEHRGAEVSCLHADCDVTFGLILGTCQKHLQQVRDLDLIDELCARMGVKREAFPDPPLNSSGKPYRKKRTRFGRRAPAGAPLEFLKRHVGHKGDACVLWPFARALNGYPEIKHNGRSARAHRLICRMAHGDPPVEYFEASHICQNGRNGCVNPRHLVWESHYDNHQRRVS